MLHHRTTDPARRAEHITNHIIAERECAADALEWWARFDYFAEWLKTYHEIEREVCYGDPI